MTVVWFTELACKIVSPSLMVGVLLVRMNLQLTEATFSKRTGRELPQLTVEFLMESTIASLATSSNSLSLFAHPGALCLV